MATPEKCTSLVPEITPVHVVIVSSQAFGEKGIHARSAVGMSSMPLDIPVELEAIVEVV